MIPPSGPGYALGGLVPIAARGVAAAAPLIKEGVKRGASIGQQAANRFKSTTTPPRGTGIIDVLKDPKTLQAAMESKKATTCGGQGLLRGQYLLCSKTFMICTVKKKLMRK